MDGRQTEFGRLYEEEVWSVYSFLAYHLRHRETVEDLTQATFERALRSWSRFDPRRGSVRTWLLAIARNLLIDQHRRAGRGPVGLLEDRAEATVAGPDERFCASPELTQALAQLSDREREVIALRYGGDLSGSDTAALLDLTAANVQQIASRALRKLRPLLEDSYSAPTPNIAPNEIRISPSSSQPVTTSRSLSGRGP